MYKNEIYGLFVFLWILSSIIFQLKVILF